MSKGCLAGKVSELPILLSFIIVMATSLRSDGAYLDLSPTTGLRIGMTLVMSQTARIASVTVSFTLLSGRFGDRPAPDFTDFFPSASLGSVQDSATILDDPKRLTVHLDFDPRLGPFEAGTRVPLGRAVTDARFWDYAIETDYSVTCAYQVIEFECGRNALGFFGEAGTNRPIGISERVLLENAFQEPPKAILILLVAAVVAASGARGMEDRSA